jgi:hypothetical protein
MAGGWFYAVGNQLVWAPMIGSDLWSSESLSLGIVMQGLDELEAAKSAVLATLEGGGF